MYLVCVVTRGDEEGILLVDECAEAGITGEGE